MKINILRILLIFFASTLRIFSLPLTEGDNSDKKQITAERIKSEIVIDGILEEVNWQTPGYSNLRQMDPDQGSKPTQDIEYWFAYDDEAIYFAAKFYDSSPDSIISRLVRRDFVWSDPSDGCFLYLDSYRDKRNGYFFYVSAAGALADGLLENDVRFPSDLSWDAVWEGSSNIDDKGWSVEMKIPFSQLRFTDNDTQVWGVNVERFISRNYETDVIVYTPRNESGFVSRFPDLIGLDDITPPAKIEFLPYITGKAEYKNNNPGDPFNSGGSYSPGFGLDIRAGLGNSLTLNGTINPDFGQVELDPAIVNLTDVEYTFQEKRPFFTEGVSIYRFGRGGTNDNVSFNWPSQNIFYSRRIGRTPQGGLSDYDFADIPSGTHILGAAKISGQVFDNWKIGTIHALTQREFADVEINGNQSSVEIEPLTYYGVFRAQRDFNEGAQSIGLLSTFTNRFFNDAGLKKSINSNALVTALDGFFFLDDDQTYVITGWAAVSNVSGERERITNLQESSTHYFQRPDANYISVDSSANSLTGYSGRIMINKNRGRWVFNSAVGFVSPKFEVNDLGFGAYSDIINVHISTGYRWNEPTDFYRFIGINGAIFVNYDFGGNRTGQGYWLNSFITLNDYSGGNISFTYNPSTLNSRKTRGGPLTVDPESESFNLNLNTDFRLWWVLNFGGRTTFSTEEKSYSIYSNIELKVIPTLTLSVGPEFYNGMFETQWVGNFNDPEANETYGYRYIFAQLDQTIYSANVRADWIISPKLSFQIYLQPFITSGNYQKFKFLLKSKTYEYLQYGEGESTINYNTSENGDVLSYELDPDGDGIAQQVIIDNPNFNYISLRGNAVLRWEYLTGSTIYFVWSQTRADVVSNSNFQFGKSFNNLFNIKPDNIFILKITYWL